MKDEPMSLGGYLTEGDIVKFGNNELEIFHVPGHSPGSLAYYARKERLIFTGDVLFHSSIGRTDLPKGNYEQLVNSINLKLFKLPNETVVFPGHGLSTTIGYEKENNPYLK
jgi:glyoxylase-like metal-dependent hydrolase (beta-lactamase superfamily II)